MPANMYGKLLGAVADFAGRCLDAVGQDVADAVTLADFVGQGD